jgi:hypothetical protein
MLGWKPLAYASCYVRTTPTPYMITVLPPTKSGEPSTTKKPALITSIGLQNGGHTHRRGSSILVATLPISKYLQGCNTSFERRVMPIFEQHSTMSGRQQLVQVQCTPDVVVVLPDSGILRQQRRHQSARQPFKLLEESDESRQ